MLVDLLNFLVYLVETTSMRHDCHSYFQRGRASFLRWEWPARVVVFVPYGPSDF